MSKNLALENILFLDIETVSCASDFDLMDERLKSQWEKKSNLIKNDESLTSQDLFYKRAAIYAEFGKIVTVAVGYIRKNEAGENCLRVKAIASDNEEELLQEFKRLVQTKFDQDKLTLCAHNGKEFDFPYLCRRMLLHGIPLPAVLDIAGKKPWEVLHIDTMELWKFGDRKSYTSLELLATIFGIDSSKDDMDGSMVTEMYYEHNGLSRIATYCMQDVVVTAQLFLKLNCLPLIEDQYITLLEV
ncbi:MAG: 3'-5' exonuclease [Candidatus Cyclobacteriaceae bacterium M3_2C_046]